MDQDELTIEQLRGIILADKEGEDLLDMFCGEGLISLF